MVFACGNTGKLRVREIIKALYNDKWQDKEITKKDILADIYRVLHNGECERCGKAKGTFVIFFGRVMYLCDDCLNLYKLRKSQILGENNIADSSRS